MAYFVKNDKQLGQILYNMWKEKHVPGQNISEDTKNLANWYLENYDIVIVFNRYVLDGVIFKNQEDFTWFMLNYS